MVNLKEIFPTFDKALIANMEQFAEIREVKTGDVLMRKGQYIKYTMLVLKGLIKIYNFLNLLQLIIFQSILVKIKFLLDMLYWFGSL